MQWPPNYQSFPTQAHYFSITVTLSSPVKVRKIDSMEIRSAVSRVMGKACLHEHDHTHTNLARLKLPLTVLLEHDSAGSHMLHRYVLAL